MGFDINEFSQVLANNNGLLSPAHFSVQITTPMALLTLLNNQNISAFGQTATKLPFFCEAAQLPGVQLATSNVQRYGYGPTEKKPTGVNFSEVTLSFIGDGEGEIWQYFQQWVKCIVNYDARNGLNTATNALSQTTTGSVYPYEIGYKDDYCIDLAIYVYDKTNNQTIAVTLREAYPIFVGDVKLNWMAGKEIMRIPVTFTFVDWYNVALTGGTAVTYNQITSTLQALQQIQGNAQQNMIRPTN